MMDRKPVTPKSNSSFWDRKYRAQLYDCHIRGQRSRMPRYCFIPALVPVSPFCFYDFMFGGKFISLFVFYLFIYLFTYLFISD